MVEQVITHRGVAANRQDLGRSVVQVLDARGSCAGTGFLLEGGLLVCCAHVLTGRSGGDDPPPAGPIMVRFAHLDGRQCPAEVVPAWWRSPDQGDVAFLRLAQPPPDQTRPLQLAERAVAQRRVRAFGFAINGPAQGQYGYAVVGHQLISDTGQALVQLRNCTEITEGFSGAPVVDERTGLVVGMVDSVCPPDRLGRGTATAYLTPAERLRAICPQLPAPGVRPYRGLAHFTSDDIEWFFGRDRAVDLVLQRLRAAPERRVLALLGPSGSGKTSLVLAGVLSALAGGALPGSRRWASVVARPGGEPFAELERGGLTGATQGLVEAVSRWLSGHPDHDRLVVVLDQFEELFGSSIPPADRRRLLEQLADLADRQPRATVLLVMRDEFYSQLAAAAPALMRRLEQQVVNVPPTLERDEVAAIVAEPAARAGLALESGLVEDILGEATGPEQDPAPAAVLPLLESALTELWEARADGALTREAYRRIGGLTGALAGRCDKAFTQLPPDQQAVARSLLVDLVEDPSDAAPGLPLLRGRRRRSQLSPAVRNDPRLGEVAATLADRRLLVTSRDPGDDEPVYEIVHDSLLRHWGQLRAWLDADREFRAWRARLEANHRDWATGRGQLLTGGALDHAEQQLDTRRAELPDHLAAYIQDSSREDRRQRARDRRRIRQLTLSLVLVLLLFAVAAGTGGIAVRLAQQRSRLAESQHLAATGNLRGDRQPELAIFLSLQALSIADTPQAYGALQAQLSRSLHSGQSRSGHTGPVRAVAFSPGGATLATAGIDRTVRLWDVASRAPIGQPLAGHAGAVNAVVFSPDGVLLATAGADQTVRLWDVASRALIGQPLTGHAGGVNAVVFSPDGALLATASDDATVRLWDSGTGTQIGQPLAGHAGGVNAVAFSPDGGLLASVGFDRTVRLWDVASGTQIGQPLTGHAGAVNAVVFSPDGALLATASADQTVRLWDVASRQQQGQPLAGHTSPVGAVAFSPDGALLASTGNDGARLWEVASHQPLGEPLIGHLAATSVAFNPQGTLLATTGFEGILRLWEVASRQPLGEPLVGHTDPVHAVAFSPDGALLASTGADRMVRLWDVVSRQLLGEPLAGHAGAVNSVAFSPDRTLLASASNDTTVRLWDAASRRLVGRSLAGHGGPVRAVVFSPDGALLATASDDQTVRLWDVASRQLLGEPLAGHAGPVRAVVFSPDGALLASASTDQRVRLWDVTSGQPLGRPFTGHDGQVESVAFSPDGALLATASMDQTVRLWDVASRRPVGGPLTGHAGPVLSVAFSPDGDLLASVGFDRTVRLWDVASRQPLGEPLSGHAGSVLSVAFSPDGARLATASDDRTVRLWASPRTWIDQACELVGRNLSQAEWDEHIGRDRPYVRHCEQFPAGPGAPVDAPAAQYPSRAVGLQAAEGAVVVNHRGAIAHLAVLDTADQDRVVAAGQALLGGALDHGQGVGQHWQAVRAGLERA